MSDLSKRMLDGEICNPHFCKDMSERGDCLCVMSGNRIAELEAALRFANEYVGRLALALAEKHYPEQRFELLPDLLGRIDQIDNMTCGLHRAKLSGGKDA